MPTATDFNPRTSFANDWELHDGVEDGVLVARNSVAEQTAAYPVKLLKADTTRPDFQRYGLGVNFSPTECGWYLWLLEPSEGAPAPDPPTVNDAIELTRNGNVERWMIQRVAESQVGSLWVLACTKGYANAPA